MLGTSSEWVKPYYTFDGVTSGVIYLHNGFISTDILNEYDKYLSNESNSSHTSDAIVSDVEYSHKLCTSCRILSQWYDKLEAIKSFARSNQRTSLLRCDVAEAWNANFVQNCPYENDADAYIPSKFFAGESGYDESNIELITDGKSIYSCYDWNNGPVLNVKGEKKNIHVIIYTSQNYMMEYLHVYALVLTYNRSVRYMKTMPIGNIEQSIKPQYKEPTLFRYSV